MSYASVAAHNAPPPSQQPHVDLGLLNTEPPSADNIAEDATKVNLVPPGFKDTLASAEKQRGVPAETYGPFTPPNPNVNPNGNHQKSQHAKDKARKYIHEVEEEGFHLWNVTKDYLFRPSVAGGLIGLVNVGLISGVGYTYYACPHLRRDTKILASTAAAALTLFGAEGYLAETYRKTPAGREEERRAREEGAALYRYSREHLLRPGVLGGLVGVLNAGVLGGLGYLAYTNWDAPRWDRRTVSAISVSVLTLWAGEGYVAEQYRKQH
ncbi:hypothetical protein BXZ70DRAFT_1073796 [Cristinia sonorae]|uniref:Uncharacterized protein n=1 Tax=Cristinia sonorae TaxID=1940300 RepID=A0A8K0UE74_9AGAR|nr:hypothetical protein BXZ70DRAFT_1073796 [Cristinia sonorae]